MPVKKAKASDSWSHNGKTYRIVGRVRHETARGYIGSSEAYSALHRLATGSDMQITATDAWDEDDGYCLFFHFENFREPPEVRCATPLEIGFDPAYWNYFSPLNFNGALEQAEKLHTEQNSPSLPTNKTT